MLVFGKNQGQNDEKDLPTDGQGNASSSLSHASYICWYIKHPAVEKHPDESSINTGSSLIEKMSTEKLTRTERHLKSTVCTAGSHSTFFYGLWLSCQILIIPLAVHKTFSLTIFLPPVLLHSSSTEPAASTDELALDYIIWIRFLYWQSSNGCYMREGIWKIKSIDSVHFHLSRALGSN